MKILVTGADGLVGTHYLNYSRQLHEFLCPKETEMDITDPEQVEKYISENEPECLINFAAFTDYKGTETQRDVREGNAWKINVEGVKNLAESCKKHNIFLIQISTDLIFSGKEKPSNEYYENETYSTDYDKICWYGITKLEGELALIKHGEKFAIVRIAYPFAGPGHTKKDLIHTILYLFDNENLYPMFTDNTITPTLIDDLAVALNKIVENKMTGTFHVVSHGPVSHFGFAKFALENSGRDSKKLQTASLAEFAVKFGIPRPLYINLNTEKTEQALGIRFGTIEQNTKKALESLSF